MNIGIFIVHILDENHKIVGLYRLVVLKDRVRFVLFNHVVCIWNGLVQPARASKWLGEEAECALLLRLLETGANFFQLLTRLESFDQRVLLYFFAQLERRDRNWELAFWHAVARIEEAMVRLLEKIAIGVSCQLRLHQFLGGIMKSIDLVNHSGSTRDLWNLKFDNASLTWPWFLRLLFNLLWFPKTDRRRYFLFLELLFLDLLQILNNILAALWVSKSGKVCLSFKEIPFVFSLHNYLIGVET